MNRIWKNLCLKFVCSFCGSEKVDEESKEALSSSVTLSEKLERNLREDAFTELAGQHKELTNEWNRRLRERDSQHRKWPGDVLCLKRHC